MDPSVGAAATTLGLPKLDPSQEPLQHSADS